MINRRKKSAKRTRSTQANKTSVAASPAQTGLSTQLKAAAMEKAKTFEELAGLFIELLSEQPK